MKKEVNENKKEKKVNQFLKALYNIFIADPDSLSGEIPGLAEISKDIEDNGTDEDKKMLKALQESERRIDDKVFKASLKVTPAKVKKLVNKEKETIKEEREISK